jgi:hypothetical protein
MGMSGRWILKFQQGEQGNRLLPSGAALEQSQLLLQHAGKDASEVLHADIAAAVLDKDLVQLLAKLVSPGSKGVARRHCFSLHSSKEHNEIGREHCAAHVSCKDEGLNS